MDEGRQEGIILLHGLGRSRASMAKMASALKGAGFIVLNVQYPSRRATVAVLSEATLGRALNDQTLSQCERIHCVAHSLGGILLRCYFARHQDPRLGRVVMLGTPNQGSELVDILSSWRLLQWLIGPAGAELGTGDEAIANRIGPVEFELGVIAGDRSINWINSLLIPGRDDGTVSVARTRVAGMKEHLVVHACHPLMMRSGEVIARTISFLQSGSFFAGPSPHRAPLIADYRS